MIKRIAVSAAIGFQPAIVGALAGMEFVTGFDLAFVYTFGIVLAGMVYSYPGWSD